tara:strand:- start:284 stop:634 length:351 start_codon:yes stop_codon:yes gene_type:complete
MKAIFKIDEYLPETNQIVIRFAKLHSPQHIDNYEPTAVGLHDIDLYDNYTFIEDLMKKCGDRRVLLNEEQDPIVNQAETLIMSDKVDLREMVGKVIECKTSDKRSRKKLRMRKIDL